MNQSSEIKWPWFEREFAFDFPPEKLPDIVERLNGTTIRLLPLLELGIKTRTSQIEETWSIQENVGHLLTLEPLWLGRVNDIMEGRERLRDADLENQATGEAKFNQVELKTIIDQFASQRSRLVEALQSTSAKLLTNTATHPRLETPMRIVDIAFFVAEHDDYHLARITWIRRTIS